jgi:ATP phosphoribosyltransferase
VHVDLIASTLYGACTAHRLADAIVDLVASGHTLKANALAEVVRHADLGPAGRQPRR